MGKKARMRRYPQKYGKKFGNHPYFIAKHGDKPAEPAPVVEEEVVAIAVPDPAAEPIAVEPEPAPVKPKAAKKKPAVKKPAVKKPAAKRTTTKRAKRTSVKKDQ